MNPKKDERKRIMKKENTLAGTLTALAWAKPMSQKEIGERAYQKWESAGKPNGKDLNFWLEAQRELSRVKQQLAEMI
jgi:hypothetical protein